MKLNLFLSSFTVFVSLNCLSQSYVDDIKSLNTPTSSVTRPEAEKIIVDYLSPVEGSKFYSENNQSNKYVYSFFPDYPLTLGRGLEPNKLQESKFSPLQQIIRDTVDGLRPLSTNADIFLVSNKDELRKVFDLDVKMSVRALGFKANSSLNIVNTYNFDQNNIMVVIKGQSEFSRIALKNPQLSDEAKKILNKRGGYNEFIRLYGSNIVSVERRGLSVYFLITINNVTTSLKNTINTSLDAGGGFGPVSGSLEVKLRQELYQKSTKEELNIRFISFGCEGLSDFASIIAKLKTNGNSFEDIKNELSNTLKNCSAFDKSIPIGYLVTPITNIPSVFIAKSIDSYSELQEKYLAAVSEKYFDNLNKLSVFQGIINQTHPLSWYSSPDELKSINEALPIQRRFVERLRILHDTLLNHFDLFVDKPESEIQSMLVYINTNVKPILDKASQIIESKYFTIKSTSDKYAFSGFGIKSINFYLQGELYDYTKSEIPGNSEYKKSQNIYEVTPLPIVGTAVPSEIMGTITSFEIDKTELKNNLENAARGLKEAGGSFLSESNEYKYFSVTCVITSLFGKQVRLPIGYILYNVNSQEYKAYLRPELVYKTAAFINRN